MKLYKLSLDMTAYLPPPLALNFVMYYFQAGDTSIPPSLNTVFSSLASNEFLVRGNLYGIQQNSALVYNSGVGTEVNYYDSYNIESGNWIAVSATGFTWRIASIYTVTDAPNPDNNTGYFVFYAKITDVDNYNASIDPSQTFSGAPVNVASSGVVFTVDEDGFPIFSPADTATLTTNFSGNVIGRFRALNTYNKYLSVYQENAYQDLSVGDPVYISSGKFYKSQGLGDVADVNATLGIVTSISVPTVNYFTFNPFGEYRKATGLTGEPGTVYYIDPTGVNQYTNVKPTNYAFSVYTLIDTSGNAILNARPESVGGGSGSGSTGPTGPIGPTGPAGPVTSYIFDGGDAYSVYTLGPAFDCGTAN